MLYREKPVQISGILDDKEYPIGLIANDIEIHFIHYKDEDEAYAKWSRRVKRINWDNLIVKFCDRDQCTEDLIRRFDKLPYSHKVCFTAKSILIYRVSVI